MKNSVFQRQLTRCTQLRDCLLVRAAGVCWAFWPRMGHGLLAGPWLSVLIPQASLVLAPGQTNLAYSPRNHCRRGGGVVERASLLNWFTRKG